jgi:hypothetical protein
MAMTTTSNRRAMLMGLGGLGATSLAGCVTPGRTSGLIAPARPAFVVPPLAPLRMSADRITKITVCLRPFRATGTWSPDSRVADADKVAPGFPALWEEMARTSYATYQTLLGLPGEPVSWSDRYTLFDGAGESRPHVESKVRFAEYGDRLHDIVPGFSDLPAGSHPFPVGRVRHGTSMQFNVTDLAHMLTNDFLMEGGKIVAMNFDTPADLARLKEPVVVNCTGYGARALWKDETITPVRGQIAWLAPQPEVRYGLYYRHVSVLPRPDGIVVQQVGDSDMWGYGVDIERPDRAEAEAAVATIAGLVGKA